MGNQVLRFVEVIKVSQALIVSLFGWLNIVLKNIILSPSLIFQY